MSKSIRVPGRFSEEVALHLLRCYSLDPDYGASQILLVIGQAGSGKTCELAQVVADAGVERVPFGADQSESEQANKPVVWLRSCFNQVRDSLKSGVPSALIIDNADLLLGRYSLTQYTHNLQRITSELLRVASSVSVESAT